MTVPTARPTPKRTMQVRRVRFTHPEGSLRRHYVVGEDGEGDLVMSHVVAVLSATFPPGEDFFIRSVQHYSDRITDPELKRQVKVFIGQEVVHGREHDALNQALRKMGYPTHWVDAFVKRTMALSTRFLPPRVALGHTAALEHYTATLAECLLTDPRAQALLGESKVRDILLWHALEEAEHKAVAFDVYRAVGGSERMRRRTMIEASVGLFTVTILFTLLSLLTDPATYNPRRLLRSLRALRHSPFLTPEIRTRIRAYHHPTFHPDNHNTTQTLTTWRTHLFPPTTPTHP
ncbi:metal-dependent hydrolase [Actinocorallia sp. A-T 12471]|uniref:metal-dependent hydrolase n=1 Tax=Actinocorallia sp. A-T 12471 TaxID=3089813 RepID=UPI0029CCBB61|nr:metal-dependent hydrolase [Actinocorallia sp. A-T 12471]MDX6742237.1 metal-dependent hydrolase [Actinocorallia sp. A-T 12471]